LDTGSVLGLVIPERVPDRVRYSGQRLVGGQLRLSPKLVRYLFLDPVGALEAMLEAN
jgi:hypothetical protein